jgi:XTP/dITP diphosphohydrolase
VIEDGLTFAENALKKARSAAAHTGCAALADDSGLVIDALNGEPGIQSARYAGDDADDDERNRLVLDKMRCVPDGKRSARFVCAIAIVLSDGTEYLAEGVCEGTIIREMRGNYGFGYDPIFFLPECGRTMAEIPLKEKNRISHRARALESARKILLSMGR